MSPASKILSTALIALGLLCLVGAEIASAAAAKRVALSTKVGRSNVQIDLILHPQVDRCSAGQMKEMRRRALELGQAHVRENLTKLIRQAGTDASKASEFFGVSYLAGCPADGSAWLAFPASGKDKSVTRFAPEIGWSAMLKL